MRNMYQIIDAASMKQEPVKNITKKKKADIPEGYISSEEFAEIFEQKLLAAYENV